MTKYGEPEPVPGDTGRKGYLEPDEPPDGIRRRIDYRPFWRDESERLTYEHAAETHKRRPGEGPGSYIARLADLAEKRLGRQRDAIADLAKRKGMPEPEKHLTDWEWNERNNALQAQRDAIEPEPGGAA